MLLIISYPQLKTQTNKQIYYKIHNTYMYIAKNLNETCVIGHGQICLDIWFIIKVLTIASHFSEAGDKTYYKMHLTIDQLFN